ncbi:MAG: LysM peptidoglycan-binding domain-containing protein [Desulfobacterium sp.]|nr:LysM peptidoglycan-binding domain-containing protein [Desulfobacterium sp.]
MYLTCKKFILLLCAFFVSANVGAASLEQSPSLYPDFAAIPKGTLTFCGEPVPFELQDVKERFEKEILLSSWDRAQVLLWLKRSRRYLPHIEKILKENGMPDDLKYIAVAESALRPNATSNKSAVGYWQFIHSTGLNYGLTINENKDERRNFFTSTQAAVSYLRQLNSMLGSWTLAAAGYNMGEEGLLAQIHEQETNNFYRLYLPEETQRYIFRILSIKLIMQNPAKYGFKLEDKDYYPPISFDRVDIECSDRIPLMLIAKAASTTFKEIKDLNPEIRGHFLQKGIHTISIQTSGSKYFMSSYKLLVDNFLSDKNQNIYIVKKGDTLISIAKKLGVPLLAISIWNDLDNKLSVKTGDRLLIYQKKINPDE